MSRLSAFCFLCGVGNFLFFPFIFILKKGILIFISFNVLTRRERNYIMASESDDLVATRTLAAAIIRPEDEVNVQPGPSTIQRSSVIVIQAPPNESRGDPANSESDDEILIDQSSRGSATESGASSPVLFTRRTRRRGK